MAMRDRALVYLEISERVQRTRVAQEFAAADLDDFLHLGGAAHHRALADAYQERADLLVAVIAELRRKTKKRGGRV